MDSGIDVSKDTRLKKAKRYFYFVILTVLALSIGYLYVLYHKVYAPNVTIKAGETEFYLKHGNTIESIAALLFDGELIKNKASFIWVAKKKNLQNNIHPGKYILYDGLNNNDLVNRLRSADQETVELTFSYLRTYEELCGKVGRVLELDSATLLSYLNDEQYLKTQFGLNKYTGLTLFIPNTYQLYWGTLEEDFLKRMADEYKQFWNQNRMVKCQKIGLSQSEVVTLASIVLKETSMKDEMPRVAGVYMNRLHKKMPLQADPTLIYALKDFTIRRVLNKHKKIESPYNTYKYAGLPPGPICIPEISAVDAVLNFEKHDYFYFCAKEDFSGYSNFAKSYREHINFARKYQRALNKRKIYK